MKIVFVNRYFYPDQSATSQLLTDLATELAGCGLEIHVICSRQRYDDATARLPASEKVSGVSVKRVWTSRFGRDRLWGRALDYATFYGSSAVALTRMLRRGDTVIAKTDPPLISIVALAAAKLKGARLINWLQDIFPEVATVLGANPLPRPLNALLRTWRDASLLAASTNVVLGERMRERLQARGIPAERIRVVENWAERDPARPKPVESSALRAQLRLCGKFVVCYSGNLGRAHDFQTLLRSAESLRAESDVVFLMIGGGSGMRQLSVAASELGLQNFLFLPYQPRESLADTLAAGDVHWLSLLPGLEGLIVPSKFYGILAAGRPVIFVGDPEGELPREIRAGGCGAAVAINQAPNLTALLKAWQSDPALRERMGRRGREHYDERFSALRAFDRWKEMLKPSGRAVDALSPAPLHR